MSPTRHRSWSLPALATCTVAVTLCLCGGEARGAGLMVWSHVPGSNGTFDTGVNNQNRGKDGKPASDYIHIRYTPDPTKISCPTIYLTQTCRMTDQNGATIQAKDLPGDILRYAQPDMTPGGTYVDHLATEKDSYYNGEDTGKDSLSKGSSDGTTSKPTDMGDMPFHDDRDGFPPGVTKVTLYFEVCARCKETGKILDCITWTYSRTKGDTTNSGKGMIVDAPGPAAGPSTEFITALAQFEKNHKNGTRCPEGVAEGWAGQKNVAAGAYSQLPAGPHPGQPTQLFVDVVNTSGQPVSGLSWDAHDQSGTRLLAFGSISSIDYFDYTRVNFTVPPVASPGTRDSVNFKVYAPFSQYDNSDDADTIALDIQGIAGVDQGLPPAPSDGILVAPDPFRTRTTVRVLVPRDIESARLSVYDASGRRVRGIYAGSLTRGWHSFEWDGRDAAGRRAASGSYLLRLEGAGTAATAKVVLLR